MYEAGNEADRLAKINSLEGVKFSKKTRNTAETEPSGERKYSINRNVYNELDEWLSMSSEDRGKSSGRFLFGTTSKALRSIGAPDYKIYWDKSSLAKKMKDHKEFTPRVIKNLPSMIENPVMILQSESVQGSITIWGIKDDGKLPVMVSIKLDPKTRTGEIRDYAIITSAYSRPVSQLQSFINKKENILYLDPNKKRTDSWLQSLGLQLPPLDHQYGSIREVSFSTNSIPDSSSKSNPQFSFKKPSGEENSKYISAVERGDMMLCSA